MNYYRQGPMRPGGPGMGGIALPGLTPMIKLLMIACGAVWLLQWLFAVLGFPLERWLGLVPDAVIRGAVWQPLTWLFLHSPRDPFHLLFNMLMLWMFGGELERFWGGRGFLRFYFVCGIGSAVFVVIAGLIDGTGGIPTLGASGALFGVIMAFGMIFAERTVLFMMLFPVKARTMAIIMFALTFFYTFAHGASGVSHVAHLGGAVIGFLYLKRAWELGAFYRDLRWKLRRRRFKVMDRKDRDDFDRWVN